MEKQTEFESVFECTLTEEKTIDEIETPKSIEKLVSKEQENNEKQSSKETEENTTSEREVLSQDEFKLFSPKIADNLSEVCKKNSQNIIGCQVKADIAMQCLISQSQAAQCTRSNLEKFLSECEMQETYLQKQLNIEKADSIQIERDMETVYAISALLKKKAVDYEDDLNKCRSKMCQYTNRINELFVESKLSKDRFQEEYIANENRVRELRAELERNQNEAVENHKRILHQKIAAQEDIADMKKQIETAKKRNDDLTKKTALLTQQVIEKEQHLSKLKDEVDSTPRKKLKQTLKDVKEKCDNAINAKRKEADILSQRLASRSDYLNELNSILKSLKEKNSEYVERNNRIRKEAAENRNQFEKLLKQLNDNRAEHKKELEALLCDKEKSELNLREIESKTITASDSTKYLKTQLDISKERLNETSLTISELNNAKKKIESEIQEQTQEHNALVSRRNSLSVTSSELQNEIARLNEEKHSEERKFEILQTDASNEIDALEKEIETIKKSEESLELSELQFKSTITEDEERLRDLKESNEVKLKEYRDELQCLKHTHESLIEQVEDLSEKLRTKTESCEGLYVEFKVHQADIDRLQEEVKNANENKKVKPGPIIFQKPVGILKAPNVKSPQKRVTFDKSINWDTLSESSTEAYFEAILKPKSSTEETTRRTTSSDDIFNMLMRNSPPERD